jgi:hypothetical protein
MGNKKLVDILKSNGYLFPSTDEEIIAFEKDNNSAAERPSDWNEPSVIIKRGLLKIEKLTVSEFEQSEIMELKMAARKGEQSIPKEILDKMKSKHKNGNK